MPRSSYLHFATLVFASGALVRMAAAAAAPQEIRWAPSCDQVFLNITTVPIECGNLTVPLDYAESNSSETLELRLLKIPATKQPADGTIIVNFGGPGVSGRLDMATVGVRLFNITGGRFDLISYDQRGTVDTLPISCYETSSDRAVGAAGKASLGVNSSDTFAIGRLWAGAGHEAFQCDSYARSRGGELVGTVYTVRDIFQIVDALGGDRMLRFWGLSYGTTVGATAAAMFPDRIESMMLDGVVNQHQYWSGYDIELNTATDKTFSAFLETCFERPAVCELAQAFPDATSAQIEARVYELIDRVKYRPEFLTNTALNGTLFDHVFVKSSIRPWLYTPVTYPLLARLLSSLLQGDMNTFAALYTSTRGSLSSVFTGTDNEATSAIYCLDKQAPSHTLDELLPVVDEFGATSRLYGDLIAFGALECSQWTMPAKERYDGGFHKSIKTRKPLLLVGNEFDVVTPDVSAKNMSASFEDSVFLGTTLHGHASIQHPSTCLVKAIRTYFQDNVLPAMDSTCHPDAHPWDEFNWDAIYARLEG